MNFKDPNQMTEDEKFTICVAAGCAIQSYVRVDGSWGIRTMYPCGVAHDGEKYIVAQGINLNRRK